MLGEADDNHDGLLTQAQWSKVELWFQYKAFLPGGEDDPEGPHALKSSAAQQEAYDRAGALKAILWDMFAQPPSADVSAPPLLDFRAALLYLCSDRDMFTGIKKAFSVATASIAANARAEASQVLLVAYPLQGPILELAKQIGRAPFDLEGVQQVVSSIHESRRSAAAASSAPAAPGTDVSRKSAAASSPPVIPGADVGPASVTSEQLMYSAGGERLVVQLLHRYQWKDLYVASKAL